MANDLVWMSGAEWGTAATEFSAVTGAGFVASSADAKTGTYSYRTEGYDYARVNILTKHNVDWTVPGALYQCQVGFWCKNPGATAGTSPRLVSITGALGDVGVVVRWNVDNAELEIWNPAGGSAEDTAASAAFAGGGWVHIGVDVKINGSTGWIRLYVNGTELLSFDGNTTGGGITDLDGVLFGGVQSTGNNWNQYLYFDDIHIYDSTGNASPVSIPRYRLLLASANADGLFTDWDGSDGNSVDNYLLVDDIPADGAATFIQTDSQLTNSVGLTNTSISGFDVIAVHPHAYMKAGADFAYDGLIYVRDSNTGSFGRSLDIPIPTEYQLVFDERTVGLDSGAWDQTKINNLEVGVEGS